MSEDAPEDTLTNEALFGFIAVLAETILSIDLALPPDRSTSQFLDHLESRLEWLVEAEPLLLLSDEAAIRKLHAMLLRQIEHHRYVADSD